MPINESSFANPEQFMTDLNKTPGSLSLETAQAIDEVDPLSFTQEQFDYQSLVPLAGHSLGPAFKPTIESIREAHRLQANMLHGGHFPTTHPQGEQSAHWFDCDRYQPGLIGAQQILGFAEMDEFNFTSAGLSENLSMLLQTFYQPNATDWADRRTKIFMLGTEFYSDQAIARSIMQRAIKTAKGFNCFSDRECPQPEDEILKVVPNAQGLYETDAIISKIRDNAEQIKVICLPDIVFNTGQRLELDKILNGLRELIEEKKIVVILDLAHTVGNRPMNLESLPVTAAVGCGYKHLSGYAGSGFGIYVNRHVNLEDEYTPIQGWKAADPDKVFATINQFDPDIMNTKRGALAFRTSNPPPVPLLPAQTYLAYFAKIGFDRVFAKSECLTRYLLLQIQDKLGDMVDIITPLDPSQRGATIAIQVKNIEDIGLVEEQLKALGYETDTRPPNVMRITAHYGYTTFTQVAQFVATLKQVLAQVLEAKHTETVSPVRIMSQSGFGPGLTGTPSVNPIGDAAAEDKETNEVQEPTMILKQG